MRALCISRIETGFRERLRAGLTFESRVRDYMSGLGFELIEYGLNTYPVPVRKKLVSLNDPGSVLLRYSPDFYCVTDRFTFLVEAKSKKGNSDYFSYSLDSLYLGRALARMGVRILCVFEGEIFKAEWIQDLRIMKVCKGSDSGSGKEFVLIREADLPRLREILEINLGE